MIRLRRLEEKDIPGMLEWMHDPEINRWFRFDAASMTEEQARKFIAGSFSEANRHYAISDEADQYPGTISLENIDRENAHALYAVCLRADARGHDIAVTPTELPPEIAFP